MSVDKSGTRDTQSQLHLPLIQGDQCSKTERTNANCRGTNETNFCANMSDQDNMVDSIINQHVDSTGALSITLEAPLGAYVGVNSN